MDELSQIRAVVSASPIVSMLMLLMVSSGCFSEKSLGQAVSGTVLVDGNPLHLGRITFKPLDQHSGPKVSVAVREGVFRFTPEHGPWVGEFEVQISATPPDVEAFLSRESDEVIRESMRSPTRVIDPKYDAHSGLRATVEAGNENTFDFRVSWRVSSQ